MPSTSPRHHDRRYRLDDVRRHELRGLIAEFGWRRVTLLLGSTRETLEGLALGEPTTRLTLERLAARIDELE